MESSSTTSPASFASSRDHESILKGGSAGIWAGRAMSGLVVAFLAFDTVMKLLQLEPALKGTAELGYPVHTVFGIGVVQLLCLIAYVVPRTSLLGAVLLTGYLGGAVASHVRVGNPLFSHMLFPIYVAALIWGGLYLRDAALRAYLRRSH